MSFERFWKAWPKGLHIGIKKARKSWDKINPNLGFAEKIIEAVENQKLYRARVDRYNSMLPPHDRIFLPPWKYPVTWLNQGCWADDMPMVKEPPVKVKVSCSDCPKEYTVKLHGKPYCTRCYDNHAHPEIKRAS